ncbi:MAG: histidine phosphatase family protein [Planctomycetales bacterium]|nr:histidine phosphatase family protein [Planctomycetales bacterium]NIO34338.1 histidine phosphatase family protein [Planctomycetales bacterium]NIO46140.1 histidine phosphatase family protein [Planctomycetales bacterium]
MLKIVLIRPGTTEYDQQGRILGTLDVPLADAGNAEVDVAIDQLRGQPIQALYTSPCESARQTAEKISGSLNLKCKPSDQLKNVDHGLWQGMLVEEVKRKQPKVYRQWMEHPESVCPPEGEMLDTARHRVEAFLSKLFKKHKQGTLGIVVPEPLAGLIESYLRRSELPASWNNVAGGGSWQIIEIEQPGLINV